MKIKTVVLIACMAMAMKGKPQTNGNPAIAIKVDSIIHSVKDFSGVVLISERGTLLYHKAFGYKNFRTREPMRNNAIFELASVSKQFTAMIIMMLKEEGKISYDDPLEKYIPGLGYPAITIRHLLQHTSGLPDYQEVMDKHWDKSKIAGNDDNIEYLKMYHPEKHFNPGERYEYSNTGYMLLASVAEKTTGQDFITLCRERIFQVLDMQTADIRSREEKLQRPDFAQGHIYVPEKGRYVEADSFPAFNYSIWLGKRKGPGRISASAIDLFKWSEALYENKLVPAQVITEAWQPARLNDGAHSNYGFGWMLSEKPATGKVVMHNGDNPGYKTVIAHYLEHRKTIIMLNNNAHESFNAVFNAIEKQVFKSDP